MAPNNWIPDSTHEDSAHAHIRGVRGATSDGRQWDDHDHVSQALLKGTHDPEPVCQFRVELRGQGNTDGAAEGVLKMSE